VQYVTGSGQTQPTADRVTVYETEGNVRPVKRLHRKSKKEIMELAKQSTGTGSGADKKKRSAKTKRKATCVKTKPLSLGRRGARTGVRLSHSSTVQFHAEDQDMEEQDRQEQQEQEEGHTQLQNVNSHDSASSESDSGSGSGSSGAPLPQQQQQYLPLSSFSMAPPVPVRRSQSSFSQAAALIASFSQTGPAAAPASYLKSPREFYLDVEANGSMRKTTSGSWGSSSSSSLLSLSRSLSSPRAQEQQPEDQLMMLREVSEDSDFSSVAGEEGGEGNASLLLPPHLVHQQSLTTLHTPCSSAGAGTAAVAAAAAAAAGEGGGEHSRGSGVSSPPLQWQSRGLERCLTSSLDEAGDVDFELLEEEMAMLVQGARQQGPGQLQQGHLQQGQLQGQQGQSCYAWLGGGAGAGLDGLLSLSRSTSASSLPGGGDRDSALTVLA
jgi:hypothetical protein